MLVCKTEGTPAGPLLQLASRGQEEISLTVQLKEHLAIHPEAQIHCWTGLSLFACQTHLGVKLCQILSLSLSYSAHLHKNQEVGVGAQGQVVKILVSTGAILKARMVFLSLL